MRKTKQPPEIRFRANPKDRIRIKALAAAYELTTSGVLRRLIAEAYKALKVAT